MIIYINVIIVRQLIKDVIPDILLIVQIQPIILELVFLLINLILLQIVINIIKSPQPLMLLVVKHVQLELHLFVQMLLREVVKQEKKLQKCFLHLLHFIV